MEHVTRLRFRSMFEIWAVKVDTWWKIITMGFAFPLGLMTTVSIYMCEYQDIEEIQTPGRTCYKVMAMGAIAEWLYLLTSVSWSASIAFELFTALPAEHAREREEDMERKALMEEDKTDEMWSRTSMLDQVSEYTGSENLKRTDSSRPPSYSSRPLTLSGGLSPEKDIQDISKPDTAKISDDSG